MPHRWLALDATGVAVSSDGTGSTQASMAERPERLALRTDFSALPFPAESLDLMVLPHTLELNVDPHGTLREVERVLMHEGRVVICGLNPASLWGFRQWRAHLCRRLGFGELYLPAAGEFIGYWRLRDWLRLLGFEVESSDFGCYRPAVRTPHWLRRFSWMDRVGARWWPVLGAAYFIVAVKRTRGMTFLSPAWRSVATKAGAPVSIASYSGSAMEE